MMVELGLTIVVVAAGLLLSLTHYFSHRVSGIMERYHYSLLSFSGGTLVALNFLVLLPEVIDITESAYVFLLMLLGFVLFHVTEKYLYQHVRNKKQLMGELRVLHDIGFFADHFILGFALVTILDLNTTAGFLVLIPVFLHTISSSISLEHIHEKAATGINKVVLSLSPIIGVAAALLLEVSQATQGAILAFVLGMLMYIVSRDIIPREQKGRSLAFIAGTGLVIIIWMLMRILG